MKSKPIILVDGSSFLFRAFHALPALTNSKGQATGAMYGVINMLKRLLKDYEPEQIAVIFDPKGKTFRHDMYQEYKANRPPMDPELSSQIPPLFDIIKAMGLPLIIVDGVEADDVIGTFAKLATDNSQEMVIATSDKDMAQLVNEHVTLVNTMSNSSMDIAGVKEKFGVMPEQIIDYLSLIGDKVDNVPGVDKVGPKTAVKWLAEYETLENIMTHADEFKGKVGEHLRAALEHLPLSKQLVTIKLDVELPYQLADLTPQTAQVDQLKTLFSEYEFKTWLAEVLQQDNYKAESDYQTIFTEAELQTYLKALKQSPYIAFDLETNSLDEINAEIVGVSFAYPDEPTRATYIPCAHDYAGAPAQLDRQILLSILKPLLEDEQILKVGQNLKYDMSVLANYDITLKGIAYDTMLESYVLDSAGSRHDMDTLALKYLGHDTIKFTDVAGKGAKQLTFNQIAIEQAAEYAAEDADITLQLHEHLWPRLTEVPGFTQVLKEIEIPLVSVLSRMERTGVLVCAKELQKQSEILNTEIVELSSEIYDLAGEEFNINSPKQLQAILFEKLEIPATQKTATGQASTSESVLQELSFNYPIANLILRYRSLSKLKSTYTDKLPEQINAKTGRVHTSYHQAVTATGRLSSSEPNLQNIPIRTAEGRRIRQAFVAPEGYQLLAADYSQIELRIMAHLSNDEGLLSAFKAGQDVHKATAAEVFGVSVDAVDADQRRSAKAINFGLIYGMSAFGLAKQLGIGRKDAEHYVARYFERYPGVKHYMDRTRQQAHEMGYVETLFGRRLYLPDINASNMQRQKAAERAAINAPMQGTAADIIKRAMINIDQWLLSGADDVRMIMQVHDELVFEVATDQIDDVKVKICDFMEQAAELSTPLLVDVGIGNNWDEAH